MEPQTQVERVRATYEAHHRRMWRALLAYSGSADIADDAVAEAFAQLLRRGDAVDDPAAWVWRSSFRIAAGDLKRRQRGHAAMPTPEVGPSAPESTVDLLAAIGQLSVQQRACVVLCDLADQSAVVAARILGTSAATVRVQRMRARRRLRELLEDRDV